MIKRLLILALLMGVAAPWAHAQESYKGRWWRLPAVAEKMQLTETEIRQLDNAFEAARDPMIELKGRVEIEQKKLRALMEQSTLDEKAVLSQHRKQEAARTQLADARFAFLMQVRKIIGPDRFNKLLEIRDEERKLWNR
jgi:Spy/CpxP family protein refolding chaperone